MTRVTITTDQAAAASTERLNQLVAEYRALLAGRLDRNAHRDDQHNMDMLQLLLDELHTRPLAEVTGRSLEPKPATSGQ